MLVLINKTTKKAVLSMLANNQFSLKTRELFLKIKSDFLVVYPVHFLREIIELSELSRLYTMLWDIEKLRIGIEDECAKINQLNIPTNKPAISPAVYRLIEISWELANHMKYEEIEPDHILLGMIQDRKENSSKLLYESLHVAKDDHPPIESFEDMLLNIARVYDELNEFEKAEKHYYLVDSLGFDVSRIPQKYLTLIQRDKAKKTNTSNALNRFDQYSIIDESEVVEEIDVNFDMVAGINDPASEYHKLRRLYEMIFLYPSLYSDVANEYGALNTNSILMFGPSGVGKTYVSKAIAGEFKKKTGQNLTFINAKLSSIMDKWVGNTEKNISKLVQIAIDRGPSILFLDEIDSLGKSRDLGTGRGYQIDWVNHLLMELDRIRTSQKRILTIACTNSIAFVDSALRRRLGSPVVIPMPNYELRCEIFKIHISRLSPSILKEIEYESLAKETEGFSPADIEAIVRDTAAQAWLSTMENISSDQTIERSLLETSTFLENIKLTSPSVSILQWVDNTINALKATHDTELIKRVRQAYSGYYSADKLGDDSLSIADYSKRKWLAKKTPPPLR